MSAAIPQQRSPWSSGRGRRVLDRVLTLYLPVFIVLIFVLAPFYWMAITALKSDLELYSPTGNPLLVRSPSLDHFEYLLTQTDFLIWMKNTMIASVAATAISLLLSLPAGYALSRLRFRGAEFISLAIFVTYLVPSSLLFIPMIQVVKSLGLLDNFWSLVVVYPTFLMPFCTWLLSGYFKTIPTELEESARIDGATRFGAMWRVAFPLATPGILSAGIFSFTLSWNEFIYALTLVTASAERTIPVGVLVQLTRADFYFWGPLMAGALLGSIPVALIYAFFVEQYAAGMTAGAVKG